MTVMTEEWASFWYQCLGRNSDYDDYCIARQNDAVVRCQDYEKKFKHIADIYEDFGDVSDGFDGLESHIWKDWFEPRQHLFLPGIQQIINPSAYTAAEGHILLNIPLAKDPVETQKLLERYLADYYIKHEVMPATEPKYRLQKKRSGQVLHGYEQVRQACIAGQHSYLHCDEDGDVRGELSYKEVVANFIRREAGNLGWELEADERKRIEETGLLSDQKFNSVKVQLNRCRRDFKALAKNVIRNRFPDLSPFESNAYDHFER
ncbi:hypothetical protein [Massilia sp. Root351]|uniref:hypothetical protein n=1 Tax=Massilia sp. Root351 TaxID=1736522 RepID=UPI000AEB2ED7|nr:hypothetical protein [Massilia sp. Root351]